MVYQKKEGEMEKIKYRTIARLLDAGLFELVQNEATKPIVDTANCNVDKVSLNKSFAKLLAEMCDGVQIDPDGALVRKYMYHQDLLNGVASFLVDVYYTAADGDLTDIIFNKTNKRARKRNIFCVVTSGDHIAIKKINDHCADLIDVNLFVRVIDLLRDYTVVDNGEYGLMQIG